MAHLTDQQERFAQGCVALCNFSAAYRQAYNVGSDTKWTTIASSASALAAQPDIAARIQVLRDEAAARVALPTAAERIAEMREIETANPDEIIGVRWVNCRYCRGEGHQYQWRDEQEYAAACDAALKPGGVAKLPGCEGGFGFHQMMEPVADCPRCWGVGDKHVYVADTSKLSRAARRLYRGVKIKSDGSMEILLRDQDKATDMLNRIQGLYKDGANNIPQQGQKSTNAAQVAAVKTPEERQRGYLRVVSG